MSRQDKPQNQYIKKETLWMVSFGTLVFGFFLGVVFAVYRLGPEDSHRSTLPRPPVAGESNRSAEMEKRITLLEDAVVKNPEDAKAWTDLGNAYFDTGLHKKAVSAYQKSLALEPGNADVWTDLGVMYRRNGEPQKAVEAFDRAIQEDPKHEVSRFNKGVVLMHELNDRDGAIQAWEELLDVNPFVTTPGGEPLMEILATMKREP